MYFPFEELLLEYQIVLKYMPEKSLYMANIFLQPLISIELHLHLLQLYKPDPHRIKQSYFGLQIIYFVRLNINYDIFNILKIINIPFLT